MYYFIDSNESNKELFVICEDNDIKLDKNLTYTIKGNVSKYEIFVLSINLEESFYYKKEEFDIVTFKIKLINNL